jgi:hypothetical protein
MFPFFEGPESLSFTWPDPRFRDAVKVIVRLPSPQVSRLIEATSAGFDVEDALAPELGLSPSELPLAASALSFLYRTARNSPGGAESVVDQLLRLIEGDPDVALGLDMPRVRTDLGRLLMPRPIVDRRARYDSTQRSVLPFLESASLTVDLRIVRESAAGEPLKFVPVIVARFTFDENVQTGDTVVFQLPDESVSELGKQLSTALSTLERLRSEHQENLL